jgi:hypothetical protein
MLVSTVSLCIHVVISLALDDSARVSSNVRKGKYLI